MVDFVRIARFVDSAGTWESVGMAAEDACWGVMAQDDDYSVLVFYAPEGCPIKTYFWTSLSDQNPYYDAWEVMDKKDVPPVIYAAYAAAVMSGLPIID